MRLGGPVTGLSLSPALDLLATTHTDRRGIYLWSNQAVFGSAADVPSHSDKARGGGQVSARAGKPMLAHPHLPPPPHLP
jgi:hypothetical protein